MVEMSRCKYEEYERYADSWYQKGDEHTLIVDEDSVRSTHTISIFACNFEIICARKISVQIRNAQANFDFTQERQVFPSRVCLWHALPCILS